MAKKFNAIVIRFNRYISVKGRLWQSMLKSGFEGESGDNDGN